MTYFGKWNSYADITDALMQGPWNWQTKQYDPRELPADFPRENEVLLAAYCTGSYEGYGAILFKRGDDLYLWDASHCSCYGLEWDRGSADRTTWAALANWEPYGMDRDVISALKALCKENRIAGEGRDKP